MIKSVGRRCILCQRKRIQPKVSYLPCGRLELMKTPFNCFTTRAIHLEVVKGYDSDSSIGSFQRLANRRGKPGDVYSDCGTNLKIAKSELNIKIQRINEYSSNEQINWHFNPPAAPHMGGIWETITRTVKSVMFSMIKNTSFTDFQLMTIFTEIKAIVNNRPLTYVSDNPYDLEPPKQNHLLLGRYNEGVVIEESDGAISSRRRRKQVVLISNQFWKRQLIEWLPTSQ